jgi:hypothetical protein
MNRGIKWTAAVVAGVGAVTNLPALIIGFSFLRDWVRLHTSNGPYFSWHYLGEGHDLSAVFRIGSGPGS